MSTTRYASVLGLGFGDCGKGHFIDALTRRWQAHTVVRFNGGAQAGHNVVTPADALTASRHHTFSQFGSGTFAPGVRTVLLDPMIVHPGALLVEAEALGRIGVPDALARLIIDGQCRVTTPFHQAAGRLRELLRGPNAHGTCGVGFGETVRHALKHADQVIRYVDLLPGAASQRTLLDRLQAIRETLLVEFDSRSPENNSAAWNAELQILRGETIAEEWLTQARALARHCQPESSETIRRQLILPGCVLFEGAQGVLLDERYGFHPHTTWSSINTAAVECVAARFGVESPIEHYGVTRTYLTRHGAGPLPTHDPSLDGSLPEPHNSGAGWQGKFRRGHPDAVLLRYALAAIGRLSGLLVSHVDVFERGTSLKWCERYLLDGQLQPPSRIIDRLSLSPREDLNHQMSLTNLLENAQPEYNVAPIQSASDFLERVAGITSLPVCFLSHGPTCADVMEIENSPA